MNRRDAVRLLGSERAWAVGGPAGRCRAASADRAPEERQTRFPKGRSFGRFSRTSTPRTMWPTARRCSTSTFLSTTRARPGVRRRRLHSPAYGANIDLMVEELNATAKDGVSCIVNAGTKDLGYNIDHLRAIAARSKVHIVAAGGFWQQPAYPPEIARQTEDEIAEGLLRDAAAERWGALGEIGSSMTMTADERKVLRACCKVHLKSGLPLFTHQPHQGCRPCGAEQLDIIESMGVDPRLVCLGHLSDITDDPKAEVHKALAKRGAFLGFDTVGRRLAQPDSKKLEMVLALIDAGTRITFSCRRISRRPSS